MDAQSGNAAEPRPEPVAAGLAPPPDLETGELPASLVADFSSLTTPYCWVITEDAMAGYDGAAPSAVGRPRPGSRRRRHRGTEHRTVLQAGRRSGPRTGHR